MKKVFFAVAIVAVLAVGCKNNAGTAAPATAGPETTEAGVAAASSAVVYVNMDSLLNGYKMYADLKAAYEVKAKKAQTTLEAAGKGLENALADYQNKVEKGLVTRAQAAELEQSLTTRQQNLIQQRDKLLGELGEEEQVMLNRIHYSIVDFLDEFNKDHRYGMIISTSSAGPVLNADPSLDITAVVLEGLNKQYVPEKPAK